MSFSLDQLLIFAARAGNRALVEKRLADGANPNYSDPHHGSAAMAAVQRGDPETLNLLLEAGLRPNGAAAMDRAGLIEGALHHQQEHMAVLLLHRGFSLRPHARSIYRKRIQRVLAERARVEP